MSEARLWPVNLALAGRPVLLVGGGAIATQKARGLVEARASVRVVAPTIAVELQTLAESIAARPFDAHRDLDGVHFVVAAAPPTVNAAVTAAAHARGLFVLAVDHPSVGSAQSPAVLRRAGLTLAISTEGAAPALAGLLREALEALLPDDAEADRWVELARRAREGWKQAALPHAQRRPLLVQALQELYAIEERT
jgi:uroporphyrin-III C-methyltransferase/precorrin-2 dehydrogenase/sirohydrochlorin ferrochelatase